MMTHAECLAAALAWLAADPFVYMSDAANAWGVTVEEISEAIERGD